MRCGFFFFALIWFLAISPPPATAEERQESFDKDPNWHGHNNRATTPEPRLVRQDFGYSSTRHAGGSVAGEIGGFITPGGEAAYYAKRIDQQSFKNRFEASGKLACTGQQFHVLVGVFNSDTVNEWRTPNSVVMRLYGRGDVFYAYVEYATSRWRAGGDSPGGFATVVEKETGKMQLRGFASKGKVHTWSLAYDPEANGGRGTVTAKIDDETAICHLDAGHKEDGATFNRFGLLGIPKHHDQGGEVWLDDVSINGQSDDFQKDPGWEGVGNRRTYETTDARPRFDFGFSNTHFAGGRKPGELGGVIFRGDCRYPERLACYGDRLEKLTPAKALRASGKVSMRRGVSDSTSLIGFYHSKESIAVSDSQFSGFPMNFLGVAFEGPSREGFLVYPAYRFPGGADGYARSSELPHILPDGKSHDWSLGYSPGKEGKEGAMMVVFDDRRVVLDLPPDHRNAPAQFDRFGIVTTWIDGNAQRLYFDDLTYTCRQDD